MTLLHDRAAFLGCDNEMGSIRIATVALALRRCRLGSVVDVCAADSES